jgi:hypothetical protein
VDTGFCGSSTIKTCEPLFDEEVDVVDKEELEDTFEDELT